LIGFVLCQALRSEIGRRRLEWQIIPPRLEVVGRCCRVSGDGGYSTVPNILHAELNRLTLGRLENSTVLHQLFGLFRIETWTHDLHAANDAEFPFVEKLMVLERRVVAHDTLHVITEIKERWK